MRDLFLRILLFAGTATALLTEILSPFHLLRRGPLIAVWVLAVAGMAVFLRAREIGPKRERFSLWDVAIAAGIVPIAVLAGITAWFSPPNTFDALGYHLPRVVYWAQSGSIAFFPTPYLNQISLPPLAEYAMLHAYVIASGDRFVNLVAFVGFAGSIVGVSLVTRALGGERRAEAMAALFCATLPGAILQASGAKNDCLVSLWLVCLAYFAARREALFLGLSFGLALATKGTAYLLAPPIAAALLAGAWRSLTRTQWTRIAAGLAGGVLLLNGPQYLRNIDFSGSPVGYNSAFGNSQFQVRNAHPGPAAAISNALRNLSDQLGTGSTAWNERVYGAVIGLHALLHLDPQDPGTTWQWSRYGPPANTRHEANANNRWHLLLLCAAAVLAAWYGLRRRETKWAAYGAALAAGYLLMSACLRWQPYGARLLLPLFVLGAPLAGMLLARIRPGVAAVAICLFLLDGARLPALENWTRPLRGPGNVFSTPRDARYFSDILPMNNRDAYLRSVDLVLKKGCSEVGIDIGENQLEYPFQALLLERNPRARFVHMGVGNATARYASETPHPCAVLCLDCAGKEMKLAEYGALGPPVSAGRFLLYLDAR